MFFFCSDHAGANANAFALAGSHEAARQIRQEEETNPFAPEPASPLPAGMTGADTNDPRAKLTPGIYNAGEAAMGLKHVCSSRSLMRFNSAPTILTIRRSRRCWAKSGGRRRCEDAKGIQLVIAQLAFANSDIAFQGNHLFQGNFYGLSIYDISNPAKASLLTTMICPGGQNDVSVYKNLLFMSVEMANGRLDCGTQGFPPPPPQPAARTKTNKPPPPPAQKDRFRGVRIFDITDIKNPKQVAAVQTCRGSHTHTLVVDPNDKNNVYVYVSGTSFVRQGEELAGCSGETPDKDPNTALISHRRDQGAAGRAAGRADRFQSSHFHESANRCIERPE